MSLAIARASFSPVDNNIIEETASFEGYGAWSQNRYAG